MLTTLLLSTATALAVSVQQPDTMELRPLVVTATRVAAPLDAVSTAVTVLSGERLRARGITTVLDALRSVPGAQVVQTGSYGGQTSLFLRGGESDYVKVLLDGVPLNDPGGAFDWAHLTTDAVDRIEIVRGPTSVLYGSDAVAGVVQIFTRRGAGRASVQAGVEAGRYGTIRTMAQVGGATRATSYLLGARWGSTDGLYGFNSGYRNTVVNAQLRVAPDTRSDAALTARYGDDHFENPVNCFEQPVDSNKRQSHRGPSIGLDAGRWLTSRLEGRVVVAYNGSEARFDDDPDSGSDPCFPFHSRDRTRRTLAGVRGNLHLGGRAIVTTGAEAEWQRWRGGVDAVRDNRAAFVQVLTGFDRPLSLTVGGRLDHNAQFGAKWTGRVGAALRAGALTRLRGAVGTAFKEPTFIENFSTGFAIGDPALKPERSVSWEVGVEQALAVGGMAASITYFDQRFQDLIQYTPAPTLPDTDNFYNTGLAVARGIEATLSARPGPRLSSMVTYTYLYTREAQGTGQRLLRRPSHAATISLGYDLAGRGGLTVDARFVGDRDDMDFVTFTRVTLPPRTRVDAAWHYRIAGGGGAARALYVSARVENLLDARYEDAKNYRTPRRSVFLGGEVRFGS